MSVLTRLGKWVISRSGGPASSRFPHEEITWKCFEGSTWIAMHSTQFHGQEFVGMVEELDGTYVANNTVRGTYNTFRTLVDAMQAFESPIENASATA